LNERHPAGGSATLIDMATGDNLVIEHLRAIRAELGDHGQRLGRIETRLSAIEQTLGSLYALSGSDRESIQNLARRIERIERRLQLTDQA
jgi:archaellum component FlaC